ncbi:hypothetical protein BVY02_00815 [bacterium J17]|nr:hypothetical protein BVY02_00815 [bacterium J17]
MRTSIKLTFLLVFCAACAGGIFAPVLGSSKSWEKLGGLTEESVLRLSSAPKLEFDRALVLTDNERAFEEKLKLIREAKSSLDIAYYIFSTDYSSSLFAKELIAAADRGVRIRMLLDYHDSYKKLDWFLMLEKYGNRGKGSLEVRFFNRPSEYIIKDAMFLTLSCSAVGVEGDLKSCAKQKYQTINELFEKTKAADGAEAALNLNSGGSGLFLSALYAKNVNLLGHTVIKGQEIDFSALKGGNSANSSVEGKNVEKGANTDDGVEQKQDEKKAENLKQALGAAKIYWKTRASNDALLEKFKAKAILAFAFALYGEKLNPIYDMITAHLPIGERTDAKEALRDWDYLTEFLHHKLLLADAEKLVLGGRNVEDSYHMQKSKLTSRYVFMDTDVLLELERPSPELAKSYDRLWNFRQMVASLGDVLEHAPNDFLMASTIAEENCSNDGEQEIVDEGDKFSNPCYSDVFSANYSREKRVKDAHRKMQQHAAKYLSAYVKRAPENRDPSFLIDSSAQISYIENLPFSTEIPNTVGERVYGSRNWEEGVYGKHIHEVWLRGLAEACMDRSQEQEVVLHNAYFFLPANLLRQLTQMVDGSQDCSHVRITILTNSFSTTDLNVINVAAGYSLRALAATLQKHRHEETGAKLRYYEYLAVGDGEKSDVSLHSKVSVLGQNIIIGSANADIRSYMMDTNNGLLIQNAPNFRRSYLEWVEKLLADNSRTEQRGELFFEISISELEEQDRARLTAMLGEYLKGEDGEMKLPSEPIVDLAMGLLRRIYDLSKAVVEQRLGSEKAGEDFDRYYKLL